MPRITISYRRNDSFDITGRIYDRLAGHFGREAVFRDIEDIPPGADFRRHIDRVLDESDIVLAIVGPRWIGADDERRRLASPDDPVRLEIENALRKNKPLIPVLVSRAVMPPPDALPDSLHDFAYRNAVQVDSGEDFDFHVRRLIRAVEKILRIGENPATDEAGHGVIAAVETMPRIEPANAEPPLAPLVDRLVQSSHTVRRAIALGVVVMLGAICVGGWRMSVYQHVVAAEKAEEQARQAEAEAKAQVEDALRKGNAEALDSKVYAAAMRWYRKAPITEMPKHRGAWAGSMSMIGAYHRTTRRRCAGTVRRPIREMPMGRWTLACCTNMVGAYHRTTPRRCAGTARPPIRETAMRRTSLGPCT
jgi:hypothetical protein